MRNLIKWFIYGTVHRSCGTVCLCGTVYVVLSVWCGAVHGCGTLCECGAKYTDVVPMEVILIVVLLKITTI